MKTYAESTSVVEPAANPSRPSVRFTAFEDAVSIRKHQSRKKTPRCRPVSRTNDRFVVVPLEPE